MIFKVVVHNEKHSDTEEFNVAAKGDVEARAKAVTSYVKDWNRSYKDDETGKTMRPPQIKESDCWCEISIKARNII